MAAVYGEINTLFTRRVVQVYTRTLWMREKVTSHTVHPTVFVFLTFLSFEFCLSLDRVSSRLYHYLSLSRHTIRTRRIARVECRDPREISEL